MPGIESLKRHWWALLIRGIIAVIFGIICFFETGATIAALVFVIGFFFILDGILMLIGAARSSSAASTGSWWALLLGGVLGIVAGILTFMWPGLTAFTLAMLVAAWALITGVFELITAIRLRKTLPNDWLWILNGVLSIFLGIIVVVWPAAGLIGLVYLLGFYALIAGFTMIGLAFKLRTLAHGGVP